MKRIIERIKSNFQKNRFRILAFLLIWFTVVFFTLMSYQDTLGKRSRGNSEIEIPYEVNKDTVIEQTIKVDDGTDAISIFMVTYARKNKGNLYVTISDLSEKNIYAEKTIDVTRIQDNAFMTIGLDRKLPLQMVKIRLSSDSKGGEGAEGEAVGVYCSSYKAFDYGSFKINDVVHDESLCVRYLMEDEQMMEFSRIAIVFTLIVLSLMIFILLLFEPKYELLFAVMCLLFGIIFMFIITPFSVPDEGTHYRRSLELSNSFLFRNDYEVEETYLDYRGFYGHHNASSAYRRLLEDFNAPAENLDQTETVNVIPIYTYLGFYTPQALGLAIGRLFRLNMLKAYYLGRFTNLLFYVLCVYVAIRKTPVHKLVFGLLSVTPMFMQQAASYSYDGFIFGLSFAVIAYFLKWYLVDEEITVQEYIVALIANIILSPAKFVYCIFSFLYWFIPEKRFKSRLHKFLLVGLICAEPLRTLYQEIWLNRVQIHIKRLFGLAYSEPIKTLSISSEKFFTFSLVGKAPAPYNEPYTFTYVLQHPMETLQLFYHTIRYSVKLWFYSSIGRTLSALGLILPLRLVQALPLLLLVASFRKEEYVEPIWLKALFIFMCVISAVMTLFGMLLGWTSTESEMIEGIQGRYFSPLLPYFFAVFNNGKLRLPKKIDSYAVFMQIILLFETIVYILSYTFVN